ncbi:hypothetical protein HPO96_00505 [Kribbella sandramycini]|uniref:Uncharacterized protein n=1 Tax=Kribbella sandramycini TaxID=60450 RepID=A0A7Y4KW03_9ACTN|nr:hypothetical protein [Kribbella sandramycini]MBB6568700.1 hypothetical protein [Kribbella sandramycini]NOL38716.1 hypothetical protein [Kribbella sandramycini]
MGRTRRRSARFRSWGWVLVGCAAVAAYTHNWRTVLVLCGLWLVYILFFCRVRCRVETAKHQPCGWIVRGFVGTCLYHDGLKHGVPRFVRGRGFVGLPDLMWPREDFAGPAMARVEPPPKVTADQRTAAAESKYERWGVLIAVSALVVTIVGVVRDFVAG